MAHTGCRQSCGFLFCLCQEHYPTILQLAFCGHFPFLLIPGHTLHWILSLVCLPSCSHCYGSVFQGCSFCCPAQIIVCLGDCKLLEDHVFCLHDIPDNIISDRGSPVPYAWQAFCQALGAKVNLLFGFHPQTSGQTERANQDLDSALCCFSASKPVHLELNSAWIIYAHNCF